MQCRHVAPACPSAAADCRDKPTFDNALRLGARERGVGIRNCRLPSGTAEEWTSGNGDGERYAVVG